MNITTFAADNWKEKLQKELPLLRITIKTFHLVLLCLCGVVSAEIACGDELAQKFAQPPADARPWVYWFWNNGNVTSNGITADLEAMQRVGIGGVLIMDVVERFAPPSGTAEFMNDEWRNLFQFSVQEAARLGLEINMANGPGWCGSSGPWITPELSMQMLVSTNMQVAGPTNFSAVLPAPNTGGKQRHDGFDSSVKYDDFYRDIAVLAFPDSSNGVVAREVVIDLTAKMGVDGKLNWEVPPGRWIIQRIGHTTTGSSTRPPVAGGNGLECDKLSSAAFDVHFANMMHRLVTNAGPLAGKALVATHIDSWEVGSQNWTPTLREEFQKRRGYDPLTWLPCLMDTTREKANNKTSTRFSHNFDGAELANRFRWDYAQTVAELLAENYSGRIAELAHQHGLRYSIEGYDLPFGDQFTYTARADEPMTEFWWSGAKFNAGNLDTRAAQEASVAHVYGRAIVGAEAFTAHENERWKATPADLKAQGDFEFSQGVNRFVFHRYAHQPYLDRVPGATMGPWGQHYERTQTWWKMSSAWHEYLARCQYLLRQGTFVADLCYLRPEVPNQKYFTPNPSAPAGYRYDEISAEALMQRVSVRAGRLVLPDGMSYRVLVLPEQTMMTPALAEKIKSLVAAGATIIGPKPQTSPSLQDFPQCDRVVAKIGDEVWGDCDGKKNTEHHFGRGKVVRGQPLDAVLASLQTPPDFQSDVSVSWIHRTFGDAEIYFVANTSDKRVTANCQFRVKDRAPEIWNPETGERLDMALFEPTATGVRIPLTLGASDSVFVVFQKPTGNFDPAVSLTRNGQPVSGAAPEPVIVIQKATYGVPGDASRTRDLREKVAAKVRNGEWSFPVSQMAEGDDPAYGVVKTLRVELTVDGQPATVTGQDPDTITLTAPSAQREPAAELRRDADGKLKLLAREAGHYEIKTVGGKVLAKDVTALPAPVEIGEPWELSFPPKWGAPEKVTLPALISWSDSTQEGVKHFSGTAIYRNVFQISSEQLTTHPAKIFLDLGEVKVMARVKVNGQDCGVAWRQPFRVEVTDAVRSGENRLEIQVANLWPNRMIGDASLAQTNRFTWSSWEPFKSDTPLLPSGLLGPVRLWNYGTAEIK